MQKKKIFQNWRCNKDISRKNKRTNNWENLSQQIHIQRNTIKEFFRQQKGSPDGEREMQGDMKDIGKGKGSEEIEISIYFIKQWNYWLSGFNIYESTEVKSKQS